MNKYTAEPAIKTKRMAAGYYKGKYNSIEFTIQKVSDLPNGEIAWYWQVGTDKVHDWYKTKFQALQAVKSFINKNQNRS